MTDCKLHTVHNVQYCQASSILAANLRCVSVVVPCLGATLVTLLHAILAALKLSAESGAYKEGECIIVNCAICILCCAVRVLQSALADCAIHLHRSAGCAVHVARDLQMSQPTKLTKDIVWSAECVPICSFAAILSIHRLNCTIRRLHKFTDWVKDVQVLFCVIGCWSAVEWSSDIRRMPTKWPSREWNKFWSWRDPLCSQSQWRWALGTISSVQTRWLWVHSQGQGRWICV